MTLSFYYDINFSDDYDAASGFYAPALLGLDKTYHYESYGFEFIHVFQFTIDTTIFSWYEYIGKLKFNIWKFGIYEYLAFERPIADNDMSLHVYAITYYQGKLLELDIHEEE